ncbi:hypothetical protein D3C81_1796360 [compost metagenome]
MSGKNKLHTAAQQINDLDARFASIMSDVETMRRKRVMASKDIPHRLEQFEDTIFMYDLLSAELDKVVLSIKNSSLTIEEIITLQDILNTNERKKTNEQYA